MHLSTLCVLVALCVIASWEAKPVEARKKLSSSDVRYGPYSKRLKHWIYNRFRRFKRAYVRKNKIRSRNIKDSMTYINKAFIRLRFRNVADVVAYQLNQQRRRPRTKDYKSLALRIAKDVREEIDSYYDHYRDNKPKKLRGKYLRISKMKVDDLDTTKSY